MENIIFAYTRKQALEDGFQVNISTIANAAWMRLMQSSATGSDPNLVPVYVRNDNSGLKRIA